MPSLKAIATAAEIVAPLAEEMLVSTQAKLAELGRSLSYSAGAGEQSLQARQLVQPKSIAERLDALPADVDWGFRKSHLARAITQRIQEQRLSAQEYWQPIDSFAPKDRPIVTRIMELSAGSSTDVGLMRSVHSVADQLERLFPNNWQNAQLFAASPSSPGNMFAYLYRKSLDGDRHTSYLNHSGRSLTASREPVVIFDDLRHLKDADRAALAEIQAKRPLVAVDVNSFERTANFLDFAHGQPAVIAKLEGLLEETRNLIRKEPQLDLDAAVQRVLYQGFDRSVAAFNHQSPSAVQPIIALRSEPVSPAAALAPPLTAPSQVTSFIERSFGNSGARIMAAELLARDVEFHTLGGLIPKLKDLQEALRLSAQHHEIDPANDIFVIAAEGKRAVGSSDAFMTYLYKEATGLRDEQIMTLPQLQALSRQTKLDGRRIVALDDAIYGGSQAEHLLENGLAPYPHVALATLSAGSDFAKTMHEGDLLADGIRELVNLQSDFPLSSSAGNPFISKLTTTERKFLSEVAPTTSALAEISSIKVLPHMTSDTTVWWLKQFAQRFHLTFEDSY